MPALQVAVYSGAFLFVRRFRLIVVNSGSKEKDLWMHLKGEGFLPGGKLSETGILHKRKVVRLIYRIFPYFLPSFFLRRTIVNIWSMFD